MRFLVWSGLVCDFGERKREIDGWIHRERNVVLHANMADIPLKCEWFVALCPYLVCFLAVSKCII